MRLGAQGIKITLVVVWMVLRLHVQNGIAKVVCLCTHCVPILITATAEANTTYGIIGIKVWIFKGEVFVGHEQTVEEEGQKEEGQKDKAKKDKAPKEQAKA